MWLGLFSLQIAARATVLLFNTLLNLAVIQESEIWQDGTFIFMKNSSNNIIFVQMAIFLLLSSERVMRFLPYCYYYYYYYLIFEALN